MSRPRTPRYWPRMKVRGARRRQDVEHEKALDEAARINAAYRARQQTQATKEEA